MITSFFVYGTLMPGQYNFSLISAQVQEFIIARVQGYTLYSLGAYPAAVPCEGEVVRGVKLCVRSIRSALKTLDRLEGVPTFYQRKIVTLADGSRAYMYYMPTPPPHAWRIGSTWEPQL